MKKRFANYTSDKFWQIEVTGSTLTSTGGKRSTFGKRAATTFPTERQCLQEAERLIIQHKKQGYSETVTDFIKKAALPQHVVEALAKKKTITSRGRKFMLFALEEVSLITVTVKGAMEAEQRWYHESKRYPLADGFFGAAAYALGSDLPPAQDPLYFLVWLPDTGIYGCWDRVNHQLWVFPDTPWSAIEKNLPDHLSAPYVKEVFPAIGDHLNLADHFTFVPHELKAKVDQILTLPDKVRQKRVEEFLVQYEYRLLSLPFCMAMENAFRALVNVYYHIGQWLEGESQYAKGIKWFERSLLVLDQAPHFRTIFSDIFLQLSFCYLETFKFNPALRYIDIFALYDSSSREACLKIKDSIVRTQQLYKDTMNAWLREMEEETVNGYEEAGTVIRRAIESAPNDPVLHFNLACFYSSSDRVEEALHHLEEAFKNGYKDFDKITTEADLENVRHTTTFEDIRLKYLFITI
jgi:predicted DNA-binding WGR domain protein